MKRFCADKLASLQDSGKGALRRHAALRAIQEGPPRRRSRRRGGGLRGVMRQKIKRVVDWCCIAAVGRAGGDVRHRGGVQPDAATSSSRSGRRAFALLPGLPGVSLRRAFYKLTLDECADSFFIGFGALFAHRHSRIEQDAYVGPYAVIGSAWLRRGCLIGTRSSIVSGTEHALARQPGALDGDRRHAASCRSRSASTPGLAKARS